jgi:NADPH:quinone reductase-like Zn-dependent oxidoreductase
VQSKRVYLISTTASPAQAIDLREDRLPPLDPGEVRVRVAYAPVNPADLLLLTGRHLYRPTLPAPVGIEGAGYVEACGAGVELLAPGALVALPFGGTWAQHVVMKASDVVPLPAGFDPQQASMLSVNPVTAAGLLEGVSPGAWVAQNAANSAVGRLIGGLAAGRGVHVVDIVRSEAAAETLRADGKTAVVVDGDGLGERVRAAAQGAPIVRALDAVAGTASARLFSALADEGTLICYGLLSDDRVVLPAAEVVFRGITVRGFSRSRMLRGLSQAAARRLYAELAALVAGGLTTVVDRVFPLSQVSEALVHAAREGRSGKVLLDCAGAQHIGPDE